MGNELNELSSLMAVYKTEVLAAEKKVTALKRMFAAPGSLDTDRLTDHFLEKALPLEEAVPPEETAELFRMVLSEGSANRDVRPVDISFIALQRPLLEKVGALSGAEAGELARLMEEGFPRRYRLPVVAELLKALRAAAE